MLIYIYTNTHTDTHIAYQCHCVINTSCAGWCARRHTADASKASSQSLGIAGV